MNNCSQHRKDVFGKTDMKEVAKEIGDLHYEALTKLMYELQAKILTDGAKDIIAKRTDLGTALLAVSDNISGAWIAMRKVWKLCKDKM